ncbi:response regulator [Paenibacillus sp. J22TS3]|uniref:response regulator n=1 Tax=Paenibacillus sp. J22TS3 TaxID=2807192 RepID=UPI001B042935|nr:response regulator [Paenibacillus sp. J22TS3]GIP24251.1 putative transcriptional regulatory protein YesN [Paenibacillus sp. J22TS3]
MNILIADDERAIREGIKRTIEQMCPEDNVHLAASTMEAVQIMGSQRIDIVLTDILMPGMNGLEFMKISKHRYPLVKWVVISAHSEFSFAQEAVRLGARDYLLKPIGKKRLIELIESLKQEIWQESERVREAEKLRRNLKLLHEGVFRRLASGLDTGNLDIRPFIQEYPEFNLIMVQLELTEMNPALEHFIVENVLSELIDTHGRGLVISYDRDCLLGLASLDEENRLDDFKSLIKGHLTHYLKVPFHIAMSALVQDFKAVPELVLQMRQASAAQSAQPVKGSGEKSIEDALEYIKEHYSEELSLEKVASVVYLNPAYFSQLFKLKTGQGYKDYVISLRLEQAKKLLLNPQLRLAEIAERIGYQDMRHFTQVFRRKYGQTPTEFRHKQKVNVI